ncbi:uncharacterized protein LOC122092905 [Macadamia integrifolia]|uniref:uncharacterized protein LOC122092905 n=1 Tax=Macadamia integrifolia TaxID=60698 RepID=UPI001C5338C4|nr:uncharacterized protein LOC122092905 [Macadamia integrifolia]
MPPEDDCAVVTQGVVRVSSRPKRSRTALGSSRGGLASKGGRSNDNGVPVSSSTATLSRREMARMGDLAVDKVAALAEKGNVVEDKRGKSKQGGGQTSRGVKKAASARALQKFLLDLTPEVVCIAEPMVDSLSFPYALFVHLGFRAELIHNSRRDKVPNLWIIWKNSLRRPVVVQSSEQLISVSLECNGQMVLVSMIHASCFRAERQNLWMDLVALASSSLPWAIIGDFNATLYSHEKRGLGRFNVGAATELQVMVDACELIKTPSQGPKFTWMNNRRTGHVAAVLDRSFFNARWLDVFGDCSNKSSIGVARQTFPNVDLAHKEATDVVVEVQQSIDQVGMMDELFSKEAEAKTKLLKAVELHEKLWAKKARCKWDKLGDRNSKFFHLSVKVRRAKNCIRSLKKQDGSMVSEQGQLAEYISNYFQDFHKADQCETYSELLQVIPQEVNREDSLALEVFPEMDEIKRVVWSLDLESSPGLDGFPGAFFKKCWEIVDVDFCEAMHAFFRGGKLPNGVNNSWVTLIPKVEGAGTLDKIRPICMANFFCKVLSKIMAERLSCLLPRLVSEEQGVFQRGKII